MHRLEKLLQGTDSSAAARLVLVQIQEAHSNRWPLGFTDHPPVQANFSERLARANEFMATYNVDYRVLVDPWGEPFENVFQAWPDKYYVIDPSGIILSNAQYDSEAHVIKDYIEIM